MQTYGNQLATIISDTQSLSVELCLCSTVESRGSDNVPPARVQDVKQLCAGCAALSQVMVAGPRSVMIGLLATVEPNQTTVP